MAFVWLQCIHTAAVAYAVFSVVFIVIILFNFLCTHWKWPFMNIQALFEIAWVVCLLVCLLAFQSTPTADTVD